MELDRYLSRSEIEFLAARDPPRSLVEHQARLWLRHEAMEEKRVAKEAAERKAYEAAEERRIAAAARPIVRQPPATFSEKQLQTLSKVLGTMWAEIDAKIDAGKPSPARSVEAEDAADAAARISATIDAVRRGKPQSPSEARERSAQLVRLKRELEAATGGAKPAVREMPGDIERRLTSLEQRPPMAYQGVWDAGKVYSVGDFVTKSGSLWHCADSNKGVQPGTGNAWKLAVKRGRDRERR